jgi:hypothetical protein
MDMLKLKTAVEEAERFIKRAEALQAVAKHDRQAMYDCPLEQGAIKRASMDLTRALADLRRPG